nr:hypothetical protein GCM10020241_00170 [Streptoalloteichus tenebrarius]
MTTAEPPAAGCGDPYKRHPLTTPTPNYSAHLVKHRKALALSILDEGFYCHIGYFDPEANAVRVVPRQYGRSGDSLYIHGPGPAPGSHLGDEHTSRLYRLIAQNRVSDVCVTVSLVDGLALARSAAHAALSYRSVVIYGKALRRAGQQ